MTHLIGGFSKEQYSVLIYPTLPDTKKKGPTHWISEFNLYNFPFLSSLIHRISHFFRSFSFQTNHKLLTEFSKHQFSQIEELNDAEDILSTFKRCSECQVADSEQKIMLETVEKTIETARINFGKMKENPAPEIKGTPKEKKSRAEKPAKNPGVTQLTPINISIPPDAAKLVPPPPSGIPPAPPSVIPHAPPSGIPPAPFSNGAPTAPPMPVAKAKVLLKGEPKEPQLTQKPTQQVLKGKEKKDIENEIATIDKYVETLKKIIESIEKDLKFIETKTTVLDELKKKMVLDEEDLKFYKEFQAFFSTKEISKSVSFDDEEVDEVSFVSDEEFLRINNEILAAGGKNKDILPEKAKISFNLEQANIKIKEIENEKTKLKAQIDALQEEIDNKKSERETYGIPLSNIEPVLKDKKIIKNQWLTASKNRQNFLNIGGEEQAVAEQKGSKISKTSSVYRGLTKAAEQNPVVASFLPFMDNPKASLKVLYPNSGDYGQFIRKLKFK